LLVTSLLVAGPVLAEPHDDATTHHSFDDVEHWKAVFDDPARDEWQKPAEVVKALALRPGMTVADLGAGTGYFSRHLSAAVGPDGTVLAVEPEPKLLAYLRDRAEREKTANVVPILASPDDPRLPRRSTDLVLVVDTFHHIDDRIAYFRALRRVLRDGGRVAIVDWQQRPLPVGPPPGTSSRGGSRRRDARRGLRARRRARRPPYQYMLVFAPR
jgi:ubiquinone/menaquinone biosynthesis C-methylase UbiE